MAGVLTNPIAYAHVQTRGGVLKHLFYAIVYLVGLGSIIALSSYSRGRFAQGILSFWMYLLIMMQSGMALLYASSRIAAAIRRDLQDEMIDSIRLMPLPSSQAVLGYIFAGAMQAGAFMLANLILGSIVAIPAGFHYQQWLSANFILIFFCMFVWVIVAMLSFHMKAAAMLVFAVISITSLMQGIPTMLMPGLAMVFTPMMGRSIVSMQNTFEDIAPQVAMGLVAQTCIGTLCFIAACRKFRRSDWPMFTTVMGWLLLIAWQATTVLGFIEYSKIKPVFGSTPEMEPQAQVIGSFLIAMLFACMPIGSSVRDAAGKRSFFPDLMVVVCTLACLVILLYPPDSLFLSEDKLKIATLWSAAGILMILASVRYLLQLTGRLKKKGIWLMAAIVFVMLVIPLAADGLRGVYYPETGEKMTAIGAISPIGYLVAVWYQMEVSLWIPLAVFASIAALAAVWVYSAPPAKLDLPNAAM